MLGCLNPMNEIDMLGMRLIMDLWVGDVLTWELDEWNKSDGNDMRNMILVMR